MTVNGGTTVSARGWADPADKIDDFDDAQPRPPDPPVALGNNVIFKVTTGHAVATKGWPASPAILSPEVALSEEPR